MTLSRQDWEELFQHTRARLQEVELKDIDEQLAMDFRFTESPARDFIRYLNSLINALSERSNFGYQRIIETFNGCVTTESGRPIAGIDMIVEENEIQFFGTDRVDLSVQLEMQDTVRSLIALHDELSGLVEQ